MVDGLTEKPRPEMGWTEAGDSVVPSDDLQAMIQSLERHHVSTGAEAGPSKKGDGAGCGSDHQEDLKEVEKAGQQETAGQGGQDGTRSCVATESGPATDPDYMARVVDRVLLDQDLLMRMMDCLVGGHARQDVRVLGPLSLVCRVWRQAATREGWGCIEAELLPGIGAAWGLEEAISRGRVAQYGGVLKMQRGAVAGQAYEQGLLERLEVHVEVFDRMDGLQMLSWKGPFELIDDDEDFPLYMTIDTESATFVSSTPFSAASRDPLGRFATLCEYFEKGHEEEYPCCLCTRVTVRDRETGREVLMCEEGKSMPRRAEAAKKGEKGEEDDGIILVAVNDMTDCVVGALVRPEPLLILTAVAGQAEDVREQDRLYHIDPDGTPGVLTLFPSDWIDVIAEQTEVALQVALGYNSETYQRAWVRRLEAHVEVFDRMDGLQMLSLRGGIKLAHDEEDRHVSMLIPLESVVARSSTPFSAASRDPGGRFSTISEYFSRGHDEQYPCCLCTRVTLRDMDTGRVALICDEKKSTQRSIEDEVFYMDGVWYQALVAQSNGTAGVCLFGGLLQPNASFAVVPVPGQREDVREQDRLYRIDPYDIPSFRVMFQAGISGVDYATHEHVDIALQRALGYIKECSATTMMPIAALHAHFSGGAGVM